MKTRGVVLVVDDEAETREAIAAHLREAGLEVEIAESAVEAMEKARRLQPQLITLDILLKNGSGFGTLYDLRSFPETAHIPVLVLSAVNQPRMGKALGASGYLVKPFGKEELIEMAARLIEPISSVSQAAGGKQA
jgi:CheY-like chemotaxis protein